MSIDGISFEEIDDFLVQTVEIQNQVAISDDKGGETVSWVTGSTVNGLVCSLNGKEMIEMDKIDSAINSKVYLIKGSVVNNTNKLLIDSVSYDVIFIKNPLTANEFLICFTVSNG